MQKNGEEQARERLLQEVKTYCQMYHKKEESKENKKIHYAGRVYDEQELVNLVDASLKFWLTAGEYTKKFETELAQFLNIKYVGFVNSGSSANLLAFMALTSPLLEERAIRRGDEVITVSCGFPTTVTPILQYGAIPVFVDVTLPSYNIDTTQLEQALSPKTKAVMIAHTMGNPFNIKEVKAFCEKNHLWLIEDNCDALGSRYTLDGIVQYTGTFGDIGTSSFYPPHHMTTGEGGAVYTNNPLLYKIILSMRDWGRDCVCQSGQDNLCGHRFDKQFGELPRGYDHKYVYSHFGYNLKATDMQAAIGCAQLEKLPIFIQKRKENFNLLYKLLEPVQDKLILPQKTEASDPSWFGFLMTCKEGVDRDEVVQYLEQQGIQTRMLFAGNIIKHPCFDFCRGDNRVYRVVGNLPTTDTIMAHSFWIGVYPGMSKEDIMYMAEKIREAVGLC